jgi:hypothetical protein
MFIPSPMIVPPICHFEGGVVAMTSSVPFPRCALLATAGAAAEEDAYDYEGCYDDYGEDCYPDDGFFAECGLSRVVVELKEWGIG